MTTLSRAAALSIILVWPLAAAAQQAPEKPQAGQPQTDKDKPKQPAPPLFPRHRRGWYKDAQGIEVIDATPQSPPLETDDPGVPDKGEYEINLTTHADYAKPAQRVDLLSVDANYGVLPVIAGHALPTQIKLEFPVAAGREREKGLAESGQTLILPLLVARELHELTFVVNGALEKPIHDPERQMAVELRVAIGRAFTRKVALMTELRAESSKDFKSNRLVVLNAGFIHGVRNVIVYANLGHSLFSDDGHGHTYAGFGIKKTIR